MISNIFFIITRKIIMESISPQLIIEEAKKKNYTISVISDKLNLFTIKGNNKNILFKNIDC